MAKLLGRSTSGLILGWIGQRATHIVVSYDSVSKKAYIITAYEPGLEYFEPGFKSGEKDDRLIIISIMPSVPR